MKSLDKKKEDYQNQVVIKNRWGEVDLQNSNKPKKDYEIKFKELKKEWNKMTPKQRYKELSNQLLTNIKYFGGEI